METIEIQHGLAVPVQVRARTIPDLLQSCIKERGQYAETPNRWNVDENYGNGTLRRPILDARSFDSHHRSYYSLTNMRDRKWQ